jgi:hypothetical protein
LRRSAHVDAAADRAMSLSALRQFQSYLVR